MTGLTRRAALSGAGAAVAVAAVPAVSEARPTAGEVEFFHAKMTEALEEEMRLDNAFGVALKGFRKLHPKPGVYVEHLRGDTKVWCEHEPDIERAFRDNRHTMKCCPKFWPAEYDRLYWAAHRDPMNRELYEEYLRATRALDRRADDDVNRQCAAAKTELEALQEKDNCLQEAAGLGALGRQIDAADDRYFKFQRLFLDSQAETPRALLLRVREMGDDIEDGTYGRDIYDALLRDLERLAGRVPS